MRRQGGLLHHVHLPNLGTNATISVMKLTEIRKRRGLSQRALADMIGMDAATVNRAEAMSPTAKLETYKKCADALGVSLADIFDDSRSELEADLIRAFRQIPADRHAELLGLIRMAAGRKPS